MAERLTAADVACWVIKTASPPEVIAPDWRRGQRRELARCLRRSYRLELMRPGQRCLLWLSGRDDPGVQAIGTLSSEPTAAAERESEVTVSFQLLGEAVSRAQLLADPGFRGAEVLKMPAGSNPSYLGRGAWEALCESIEPTELRRAGW